MFGIAIFRLLILLLLFVLSIFISYKLPRWFQITPYPWAVSLFAFPFVLLFTTLLGIYIVIAVSKEPVNLNEMPVSYWADPKSLKEDGFGYADACSLASAQAIIKAGLPFPNYTTKDELAADGKTINKRIATVDVWLGGERFVFPAELVLSSGYPKNNPNRFNQLLGTLPHFYPKGPPAPVKDGMGPMVEVTFVCSMDPSYVNHERPRSIEESMQRIKAAYEKKLRDGSELFSGTVTVNTREDLGMIEMLLEKTYKSPSNGKIWEASYWPLNRELKDTAGVVGSINCRTRNDPAPQKRYGGVGHTCGISIPMTANAIAVISIYVSHLDQMPSIFDQVQQLILNAKKAAE